MASARTGGELSVGARGLRRQEERKSVRASEAWPLLTSRRKRQLDSKSGSISRPAPAGLRGRGGAEEDEGRMAAGEGSPSAERRRARR